MVIQNQKTLQSIQHEFNEKFPFLKIEFYEEAHQSGESSPVRQQLSSKKTIGEVRSIHTEGELSIDADQTIGNLENNFSEQYGLNAQVFRKSGNLWLQTSKTDHWTLAEANRKGDHSVSAFNEKYEA